ncbi:endoglucanase D precursor [Trichodelitschia bisporula]|uniref:Endoglucanase D n=1 Tax=Trichodelitschia bisporula TaxID=703511 RepID=A0A6G1HNB9_9PEZI|nr:endoglucanase D precursor [Trichodelitschia bisporula]
MKLTLLALAATALALPAAEAPVQCPGTFKAIDASAFIHALTPGWNLGNTLDAVPDEGSWNNPPVVPTVLDDIKKAGFKSVRLPITWTTKIGPAPDYTVDAKWLDRVAAVTDMATSRGFYVVLNVHHDSWQWFDFTAGGADVKAIEDKFRALWTQIGQKLACAGPEVAFEPINEPKGTTKEHADILNRMNGVFLEAIAAAGGHNVQRVVTLVGLGEDGPKTSQWFKVPPGIKNPWALQYHYYSPYDFIFGAWGKTVWGSAEDKAALEADIAAVRGNFTNVPLVIGEWSAGATVEPGARWRYFDAFSQAAKKYDTATILWDNGDDFLDRAARTIRDPTGKEVYFNAARGVRNALPDGTTDPKATTQTSSAFVFHKLGQPVKESTITFELNGNTVKSVTGPDGALVAPRDYAVRGSGVAFTPAFLGKYFATTGPAGVRANLTVSFSAGADVRVQLVQWDVPVLGAKSSQAVSGADLHIPVTWKGLPKIAAVKARFSDQSYLADDWTKYLGPLQQGYVTYNNHWNWDGKSVILTKGAVDAVTSKKMAATFTFEFFPRQPGNSVEYTLTA